MSHNSIDSDLIGQLCGDSFESMPKGVERNARPFQFEPSNQLCKFLAKSVRNCVGLIQLHPTRTERGQEEQVIVLCSSGLRSLLEPIANRLSRLGSERNAPLTGRLNAGEVYPTLFQIDGFDREQRDIRLSECAIRRE